MTWRFKLEEDFMFSSRLLAGIRFQNEFVTIENELLVIKKNYAWDGCSPAFKLNIGKLFPQGIWIGTWDGPLKSSGKTVTYKASLVHDALCQFRHDIRGLSKQTAVDIFEYILTADEAPFWLTYLYPRAVDKFGPQDWNC